VKVLAALTLGLLLAVAGTAQARDKGKVDEKKIIRLYKLYLKRAPSRAERRQWLREAEGGKLTLTDLRVGILSSKEYFDRHKGLTRPFFRGLYVDVLGRKPTADELDAWEKDYPDVKDDREKAVRRFLNGAQKELDTIKER
jgi:hypothetical protein